MNNNSKDNSKNNNPKGNDNGSYLYAAFAALMLIALVGVFMISSMSEHESHGGNAILFLYIVIIIISAKIGSLVEKWKMPSVLGEIVIGVILGNLGLIGLHFLEPLGNNEIILFLSELGVVILLFQIGLESKIDEMRKVGLNAFLVAVIGVITPFAIGTWLVGPWIFPDLSFNAHLFIGATLTATSVGITARVFRDLKKLNTSEAKIVLGAAVIDDVLGLVILAVVSAIVTVGNVSLGSIGWILLKAIIFLSASIVVGQLLAPAINRWFSRIHSGVGMKMTLAISFGLLFAYLASLIGLAPIVGAFAAGLILEPVHFRFFEKPEVIKEIEKKIKNRKSIENVIKKHTEKHIEDLIEPIGLFLVPIFFVMTGFAVDLTTLFNLKALGIALVITAVAVVGKIVAGIGAGKGANKWLVGWGMVPRGEVGLIFATIGMQLGVINSEVFSMIVIVVILSTLIPPPILTYLLRKNA